MISMYIGSGDIANLLAGLQTKSHQKLLQRFVSNEIPYYNSLASPIDALRIGVILEEKYAEILPDNYYPQVTKVSEEMDVFVCSLDFAKLEKGKIIDFDELKTCSFTDFIELEPFKEKENLEFGIEYIKKKYKRYYNQVQEQLYCTGLKSANMVILAVYSYEDEENYNREIKENEYIKFRIERDEEVIQIIKERGKIFQEIKNIYSNDN